MASATQSLTTYYAKRIIGDTAAADETSALLQTGADVATDTWILHRTNRNNLYGIKYLYDSSTGGQADKIELYGGNVVNNTDTPTIWAELDTGDVYIMGKVGIGYDPNTTGNTRNLYVKGTIRFDIGSNDGVPDKQFIIGHTGQRYLSIGGAGIKAYDASDADSKLWLNNGGGTTQVGGNVYLVGNTGIGYDPDTSGNTYKLYVNGNTYFNGALDLKSDLNLYTSSADSPDIVWWYADKGQEQARIWVGSGGTSIFAPSYRCYASDGTSLYSGNLVIGDGTGVTNAASFRDKLSTWALISDSYNTFMPADGTTNSWYKFGTADGYGILPAVSGGAESGHSYIGTSSWYWKYLYVDRAYTGKITIQQPAAHRDNGIVGEYNYQKAGAIWSMGASYQIKADGSGLGNLYGAAYGYAGQAYLGSNTYAGGHQFLWCENGAVKVALGQNIWTAGKVTATGGYADRTNGTAIYLNYGAAGLAASAITWLTCWNGYELRAISKAETMAAVRGAASGSWAISITGSSASCSGNANTANYQNCVATNEIRYARNGNMTSANDLWQGWAFAEGKVAVINGWRFGNGNGGLAPIYGSKVYNAVWNDFAEYRISDITEGGRVLVSDGLGHLILSTERLQPSARVISDTFGCSVGMSDSAKTPIGVAGRVLVYPYQPRENYKVGDVLCAAPNGTADIMTREEIIQYPDRIIGIVDEVPDYEIWDQVHTNKKDDGEVGEQNHTNIEVKGRIWIYVK